MAVARKENGEATLNLNYPWKADEKPIYCEYRTGKFANAQPTCYSSNTGLVSVY
jgi:hypothetical protein